MATPLTFTILTVRVTSFLYSMPVICTICTINRLWFSSLPK